MFATVKPYFFAALSDALSFSAYANSHAAASWLMSSVVNRVYFRQTPGHEPVILHPRLALQFAADDLINRDSVKLRREGAHEINRAAGAEP